MQTMTIQAIDTDTGHITDEQITGSSLQDIRGQLIDRLSVDGDRSLEAAEAWESGQPGCPVGAYVRVSLYDDDDAIRDADGTEVQP